MVEIHLLYQRGCLKMHRIMGIKGRSVQVSRLPERDGKEEEGEREREKKSDTLTIFKCNSLKSISPGTNFDAS